MQFAGREPGPEAATEAPPREAVPSAPAALRALTPAAVLALQRTAGNAAVGRALARNVAAPAAPARPVDEATFMGRQYPRARIRPETDGENGRFDAEYLPVEGRLVITIAVDFQFAHGNPADDYWIAAVGGPQEAAKYTPEEFLWTPEEEGKWHLGAVAKVHELWGGRYRFYTQKPDWRQLPPIDVEVVVDARVHSASGPSSAAAQTPAHHGMFIRKFPTKPLRRSTFDGPQGQLNLYEAGVDGSDRPDVGRLPITPERNPKYQAIADLNPGRIDFPPGRDTLTADQVSTLGAFGEALADPLAPPFALTVTGHANASTPAPAANALSQRRARVVADAITGAKTPPRVVAAGTRGADATPGWDVAHIVLGAFDARQTTVAHEFGHMFGLSDEYPDLTGPTRRDVGDKTGHSDKVQQMLPGHEPIRAHHSEDIMSVGEVVRPHHYVGFLSALAQLTKTPPTDWGIGPAAPMAVPD